VHLPAPHLTALIQLAIYALVLFTRHFYHYLKLCPARARRIVPLVFRSWLFAMSKPASSHKIPGPSSSLPASQPLLRFKIIGPLHFQYFALLLAAGSGTLLSLPIPHSNLKSARGIFAIFRRHRLRYDFENRSTPSRIFEAFTAPPN
jgi:hypothetical protein